MGHEARTLSVDGELEHTVWRRVWLQQLGDPSRVVEPHHDLQALAARRVRRLPEGVEVGCKG